ncbi:hypothetical protein [Haladaptatus sp. NG-WS-4]
MTKTGLATQQEPRHSRDRQDTIPQPRADGRSEPSGPLVCGVPAPPRLLGRFVRSARIAIAAYRTRLGGLPPRSSRYHTHQKSAGQSTASELAHTPRVNERSD